LKLLVNLKVKRLEIIQSSKRSRKKLKKLFQMKRIKIPTPLPVKRMEMLNLKTRITMMLIRTVTTRNKIEVNRKAPIPQSPFQNQVPIRIQKNQSLLVNNKMKAKKEAKSNLKL
jgi:hypothetical protein